jgi:hypothetical protein
MPSVIALPRSRGPGARHHRAHGSLPTGRTTAAAWTQAFSTDRGPGRRDEPTPDRPGTLRAGCPDLHEPGRRRGQPVPHPLPDVYRAAQPRTRQLDAVIPARLSRAMTAAAREVATPPGTTRPARRARRIMHRPGAAADLQALSPAARSHSTVCLPSPARRTGRRLIPGSRMRGTADRCP